MTATHRAGALVLHQARLETRAFWRNLDFAFFTFVLPLMILLLLGALRPAGATLPGTTVPELALFVPGILAFGVIAAAYANLAGRMAVLRTSGVLKRVRTTPIPPTVYLAGQLTSTLVTTLSVATCTILLGWAVFGVGPRPDGLPALVAGLALGIACFAALGLAVSGAIPHAESAGPITNATYIPLALVSGVFDPTMALPEWLSQAARFLPIQPLTRSLQAGYDPRITGLPVAELAVLTAWTLLGILLARRFFRWQPSR